MTAAHDPLPVIWHDLECGSYTADLALWRELAESAGGAILDVGAGTGRVTLDLARRGHSVTALDSDPTLLEALLERAGELPVSTVEADARQFSLASRFALCLVPMQTVQLLGGPTGRRSFLDCAARHLLPGGRVAVAIVTRLEPFEVEPGEVPPLPDMTQIGQTVYLSVPLAVRVGAHSVELERRREITTGSGEHSACLERVALDHVSAGELEAEAREAGLRPLGRLSVGPTHDHVAIEVVLLGG